KSFHMMVVILRVLPQILPRKLARAPCLVKRMAKQIILRDPRIQLFEELLSRHKIAPPRTLQYTRLGRRMQPKNVTAPACASVGPIRELIAAIRQFPARE